MKSTFYCREKLGIKDDDEIITNTNFPLRRKQGKELRKLQKQVKLQEENELNLRMEIQKLNRVASVLANQILELGETPEADLDELKDVVRRQMPDEEERRLDASGSESVSLEKYSGVVEENEALRKGLHEILESIHLKDGRCDKLFSL